MALVALSYAPAWNARTCLTLNPACKLHPHSSYTYLLTYLHTNGSAIVAGSYWPIFGFALAHQSGTCALLSELFNISPPLLFFLFFFHLFIIFFSWVTCCQSYSLQFMNICIFICLTQVVAACNLKLD